MSKNVLVPIAEGSEEMEAITIVNVLRRGGVEVTIAAIGNQRVKCARGVEIMADKMIQECLNETFDLIAIPGGLPGADNLRDSAELKELLLRQRKENRLYAAVCASPAVVFQTHGLLKGKKATCYPSFVDQLEDRSSSNSQVVVDGNCVTSQGPGTALAFSLRLLEELCGKETATRTAEAMLVEY